MFLPCLQTQIHVAMSIVDVVGIVTVDGFLGAAKQKGKMSFGLCTPLACVGKELLDIEVKLSGCDGEQWRQRRAEGVYERTPN